MQIRIQPNWEHQPNQTFLPNQAFLPKRNKPIAFFLEVIVPPHGSPGFETDSETLTARKSKFGKRFVEPNQQKSEKPEPKFLSYIKSYLQYCSRVIIHII